LRVAFALGAAMRIRNAFVYPSLYGFDAIYNREYVQRLSKSWELPAPSEGWAFGHPPLFYYLAAALERALGPHGAWTEIVVRLVSTGFGLATIALLVALVRRVDPGNEARALLAAVLLLFLPAHVQMSAVFGEEVIAAAFVSAALAIAVWPPSSPASWPASPRADLVRGAGAGLFAGLALLTKLSGALVVPAIVLAFVLEGWRRDRLGSALRRSLALVLIAGGVGGWFYLRNLWVYGYVYPQNLAVHSIMFSMPPGERHLADYLYVPLSTFTDPQLLDPDLLRSVWGSTFATLWFDGHRHFLPTEGDAVRRAGTLLLVLALLPTLAFAIGAWRGLRRALSVAGSVDLALLALLALTLAGYVAFTWRNPWFASVKGTYLLGCLLPFGFYASETLARWTRDRSWRSAAIWVAVALLAVCSALVMTYGVVFARTAPPGLEWRQEGLQP
jgi:4-amino-4-deoxy-L-arabinose transferase-like glycosyltransferase